jgi:peroxiredoxin
MVMRQPIRFGKVMRHVPEPLMMLVPFKQLWFVARAGRLHVRDTAPDFDLPTADKHARVELASFRGQKPVVLVFGSYT